jgi:acetyl/propionyl-CoA carboxylase alpha subunit
VAFVVEHLGAGRYRITEGAESRLAYAICDDLSSAPTGRTRTWVFLAGRTYIVEARGRDETSRSPRSDDDLALSAPMPATVVAVKVAPGQDVREGDVLLVLEAMKMELPIKAPHAGRVRSIACREGELVRPGVPLLEFEPEPAPASQ